MLCFAIVADIAFFYGYNSEVHVMTLTFIYRWHYGLAVFSGFCIRNSAFYLPFNRVLTKKARKCTRWGDLWPNGSIFVCRRRVKAIVLIRINLS